MKKFTLNSKLAADIFDGEYIIANLDTGLYYSVQGLGVAILNMLPFSDIENIFKGIQNKFQVEEAVLMTFLNELIAEEIIIEEEGLAIENNWEIHIPEDYIPAKLNRYADMKDLLLLDPIHDVNEEGWSVQGESK